MLHTCCNWSTCAGGSVAGNDLQVADAVAGEVLQQELERCKRLVGGSSACRPAERMYAEMVVQGEAQEAPANFSTAQQDQLRR